MSAPTGPVLLPEHKSDLAAELVLLVGIVPACQRCLALDRTHDVGVWVDRIVAAAVRLGTTWDKATAAQGLLTASVTANEHDFSPEIGVKGSGPRTEDARPHPGNRA